MERVFRRAAALALVAIFVALAAAPARATPTILYDGAVPGETPADQGFGYQTYPSPPDVRATVAPVPGGTVLDTMGAAGDYAGFFTVPGSLPALSRTDGYTLTFTAQVFAETHELDSRAGFTALVLGDDRKGIELAFWPDEVWAQNDGANDPTAGQGLFTHGEGAPFDTTARPVTYSVAVRGDRYMLLADGDLLLEGPLRRYRPGLGENPLALSYYFGNAIFLGDNTSRAAARVLLTGAALETAAAPPPPAPSPEPSPSPVSPVPAQTPQVYLPTLVL